MTERAYVTIDNDLCSGCGKCAATAPNVFELDDGISHIKFMGKLVTGFEADFPKGVSVSKGEKGAVVKAAVECPTESITVTGALSEVEI